MQKGYKELLRRAYSQLPPEVFERKRFEIPKGHVYTVGMRTIFHNYKEVCDALNRDPRHVLKFLSKEMATAWAMDGTRVIFQGRFPSSTIERLINKYVNEFVICPICKRPDTKIVKERRLYFLICEACGAKSSIRSV